MNMRRLLPLFLAFAVTAFADQPSPIRPNAKLTPGATLAVGLKEICVPGYTKTVRNVPDSLKKKVYAEYGITSHQAREYEIDHLISLELGGSNDIKNLWPQSYRTTPWNAKGKDTLENKFHQMLCKGTIELKTVQKAIAKDWIAAYKKYVGPQAKESPVYDPADKTSTPKPKVAKKR